MSERVQKYREAYSTMDFEALAMLRHPDFQCYYPQSGERYLSHQDWVEAHRNYQERFAAEGAGDQLPPIGEVYDLDRAAVKGGERKVEVTTTVTPFFMAGPPIVQVSDTGDLVVMEGEGTWPDGKVYKWVWIIEYRDHLVWRQTEYYAEPFDPPIWRAPFVTVDPA
jgi:hypothetical protein